MTVRCLQCDKETSNPKFCSRSCSAIYTNTKSPKRIRTRNYNCPKCDGPKHPDAVVCFDCSRVVTMERLTTLTLSEVLNLGTDYRSKYNTVRHHARKLASYRKQECKVCGYKKAVQVCHIKAISTFSLDTLISEINSPENIVLLCPNHHWELDHDLLDEPF